MNTILEYQIFYYEEAVWDNNTEKYVPGWTLKITHLEGKEKITRTCKSPGPLLTYLDKWCTDRGFKHPWIIGEINK